MKTALTWVLWLITTIGIAGFYLTRLAEGENKAVFLPNLTTSGHYQIESRCESCHGESFTSSNDIQKNCERCHLEELKAVKDSHPKSKFTDPRNAGTLKKLDARLCVACHVEHQPERTSVMGVTKPAGFCIKCHDRIAEDRPSHKDMAFTGCASAGCHNYHDNRALYEDFLLKHAGEPDHKHPAVSGPTDIDKLRSGMPAAHQSLSTGEADAPVERSSDAKINHDWAMSKHAEAGVNCGNCHLVDKVGAWLEKPDHRQCLSCHKVEVKGFLEGKHGMRLNADLPPMQVKWARAPMNSHADNKTLACVSCHRSHEFNLKTAAMDACVSCHNDEHSKNYKKSKHFRLWRQELNNEAPPDTGVSCATCHLPRTKQDIGFESVIATQHNQNSNLRPNEKMIRSVCMNCHGFQFSLNALADEELIKNNFSGIPSVHIPSIDMAAARE